jgi:hypothetical protein
MIAFLNERSLEVFNDWSSCLSLFLVAGQELSTVTPLLYKDSGFFSHPDFKQRFNSLSFPKDQRALIREVAFGSRYYRCWRPDRVSRDSEDYFCSNPSLELRDESICEAAERKVANIQASVSLVSAHDSAFGHGLPVRVSKVSTAQTVEIGNATCLDAVKRWIASERGYYDPNSRSAPRDFQTVLQKAPERFRPTGNIERRFSRRVFEEIATGRLHYVDEAHPGLSAHLEVFSASGEHLGTADIHTGELNTSSRINGRRLKV